METSTEKIDSAADENAQVPDQVVCGSVIDCTDRVCGITLLTDKLFVLRCRDDDQLEVYSILRPVLRYSQQRCITLPRLYRDDWNDLTSSGKHSCLYVSNFSMNRIQRVDPQDGSVTMWPTPDAPCGLSMTREDHLLVTIHSEKLGMVLEFDGDGNCVCKVVLEDTILWLWHAIQVRSSLAQGQYIVSHGYYDQHNHCVSLVGAADGRKFHGYGGIPGANAGQLYVPYHMAMSSDGAIFVADHHNGRVVKLSGQLTVIGCFASCDTELKSLPRRLYIDDQTRLLYVGQDDGTLTVLKL